MGSEEAGVAVQEPSADGPGTDSDQAVDGAGSAAPSDSHQSPDLPLDVVFELLKNQRRRRVLRYLEEESETVDLGTLAEELAAEENDKSPRALSSSERKRVYISLYQCHLPKLDDAGVIDFESNRGTISRTDRTSAFTHYLDRMADSDRDDESAEDEGWSSRYYGITMAGGGAYLLQSALYPSGVFSVMLVGALMSGLLAVSVAQLVGI